MKYFAVIVLYNKRTQDSVTLNRLLMLSPKQLTSIVLDNSDKDYISNNKSYCEHNGIQYYCLQGNRGISKAYNYALDLLYNEKKNDIVIWLDDDTAISQEYFDCLNRYSSLEEYDVFAPIIRGQNGVIYSPCKTGWLKGHYINDIRQSIPDRKFTAINSCLAVRLKIYEKYRYDENLFLDCVDTLFFDNLRAKGKHFFLLPVEIQQNFFQRGEIDSRKLWNRFRIRIIDTKYYSKLGGFRCHVAGYIRIIGWALQFSFKTKSAIFFLKCIRQMVS